MSQRKSNLSQKIKACTTVYPASFINSLPSGVQELFLNKAYLSVSESLHTGNIGKSVSSQLKNLSISLPRHLPEVVTYYQLNENVIKSLPIIGKLSVLGMARLYSSDVKGYESISGFLTVLNAHCSPQQFERSGIARDLLSMGYDIQPQKITLQQLDLYFFDEWNKFAESSALRHDQKDLYKCMIVIGLSSLLFLGKTVTPACSDDFFNSKWQKLASLLGCDKFIARKPNIHNCNTIQKFFSIRGTKAIFEFYRALSKQHNNEFRKAFEFIVESLRWANMEYIHLIDEYIVEKNPDLLSFQWKHYFGVEQDRMKAVYKLMEHLPESDHPFLKFLCSYTETADITRKNFKYLYGAARAVASVDNPSMSCIDREDTEGIKNMKVQIINYIVNKKAQRR